ncbi:MAG: homoserine dehydrogenase [Lentisphaerae bacterium]|nr:homoserine dehydrogenase [Lentisphaerota bacterium]
MNEYKVGILGFGTVGAGVADCLLNNVEVIAKRTGVKPVLAGIADLDIKTDRGVKVPKELLTTDASELIHRVDVVVELIGGTTVAKKFILQALNEGKCVVTANKALLAEHGEELFAAAEKNHADLYYEASVGGGIPIIKGLREGFAANRISRIYGILNGTCNYILTRMEREEIDFAPVLKDAQQLGYAEANPSLDIDGFDTAHKAAILAALAYGKWFGMDPIYVQGIREVSLADIKFAGELGYKIKLLAILKQDKAGKVEIRVHPTMIPKKTQLAMIDEVFNGVMVTGDYVGDTLFYGRGAGRSATASAVVSDVVDIGLNLATKSVRRIASFREGPQFTGVVKMDDVKSRYYLRIQVLDVPGVLAKATRILGENDISISSLVQREGQSRNNVSLLVITHQTLEKHIKAAISQINALPEVRDTVKLIRIEDI